MHIICLFRASTNDVHEVVRAFERWINERGDSNNWYEELCAINSNGDRFIFTKRKEDVAKYLLRKNYPIDDPTPEEIASHIKGEATLKDFKWLSYEVCLCEFLDKYVFIMREVGKDVEYRELFDEMMNELSREGEEKGARRRLLDIITKMVKDVESMIGREFSITDNHNIRYFVISLFELYSLIMSNEERMPFIKEGNPYIYRCFDLDDYVEEKKEGEETILVVDIHV